ncbi:MAG: hypothetical protein ACRCUI_09880 [Polymorphobacter sp.]
MKLELLGAAALALTLASCGNPPPRADVPGQDARAAMDKAAADYAGCVEAAANTIDIAQMRSGDVQAGTAATRIIKGCAEARTALIAKVLDVRRIGYAKEDPATSQSVAEQSVDAIEGELRERAVVAIVSRQVGNAATPATKAP